MVVIQLPPLYSGEAMRWSGAFTPTVAMPQVPVLPVPLATSLSLALIATGLLVFLLAALQQRWHRHP